MNHRQTLSMLALLAAGSAALAHGDEAHPGGIGKPGDLAKVDRTVQITLTDAMRFNPASVTVQRNETIRFVLRNQGKLKHEMVLGTIKELKAHAALMLKHPNMEHAEPNQASVDPGKSGELIWQFTRAGQVDFACLQAGHYEAGMRGLVRVADGPADMTDGEVRKVDREAGKLTLKHGPIRNLDMPPMTMVFTVKDKALLDKLKAGDKVRFKAVDVAGKITVTDIQPAP